MNSLKRAWLTPHDAGLAALTVESGHPEIDYKRIRAESRNFPAEPSPEHPLRHTIVLGLFDVDDLLKIRSAIDSYLEAQ